MGKLFYDFFCVLFQGKYKVKKIGVIIRAFFSLCIPEPMTEMPSEKGQKYKSGLASDKAGE